MEKMIKLNKSKIAALVEKSGKKISEIAGAACLAYTTCKHIIQEGKDCVEATGVDKVQRLAKALGTTVKAITIGKPFERYPKKAAPAKTTTKNSTTEKLSKVKTVVIKAREKAADNLGKKIAEAMKNTTGQRLEVPEAKLPEHIHTDNSSVMDKLAELQGRIAKLEKIVLKNSSRKKLVKVD